MNVVRALCICGFLVFLLSACVTVQDELVLRNVQVDGSPTQPPVHVTSGDMKAGVAFISPHLSVASGTVSASLDRQYEGPLRDSLPDFLAQGLRWDLPKLTYGLDLDYALTNALAVTAGVSASLGQHRQFVSYHGGIGLFSAGPSTGFRLDVGVQVADIHYAGATVAFRSVDSVPDDTLFYLDRGHELHANVFASLIVNSSRVDWPANWFLQLAISPQTLTSFVPRNNDSSAPGYHVVVDNRAESSVFWLSVTPGIYLPLPDVGRLVLGARLMKELQSESSAPGLLVMPVAQLDWKL